MRFLAVTISTLLLSSVAVAAPPNILFLFADDLAVDGLHAYGNPVVQTPHLDALATRGTLFRRAYIQGGWHGAICVASRTQLMTGRYLDAAHTAEDELAAMAGRAELWPQLFQAAGYDTYFAGKWHLKCQPAAVFQHIATVHPGGMPPDDARFYLRPPLEGADVWSPSDPSFGGYWQGGRHWSEVAADDAVDFLAQAKARGTPFLVYLAFNAPHDPRQAPQEYLDRYPAEELPLPENYAPDHPHREALGIAPELRDERLAPIPRTEHAIRTHRREYYAIISHLDAHIGRILSALEENGQAENTLIVFTADNGLALGRHGLLGKQSVYEHSIRVPLIVAGPGWPAGRQVDAPVYMHAVMPTTLRAAGIAPPAAIDFTALTPDGAPPAAPIVAKYMKHQRAVIDGRYKLIEWPGVPQRLLFDLAADPHELHDRYGDPALATEQAALEAQLAQISFE